MGKNKIISKSIVKTISEGNILVPVTRKDRNLDGSLILTK